MGKSAPAIFSAIHCTRCGMRQRSPNHTCQPSALKRWQVLQAWQKKSAAAHQPVSTKKK